MAAFGVLLLVALAFGHPGVQQSNIADGAVFNLAHVPGSVTLAFSEGIYQIFWIAISPDDAGFSQGTITFAVHFN